MKVLENVMYTKSHEWVKEEGDGSVLVGLTDYAQSSLGDIVFVNLPECGDRFDVGEAFADVESVKAVSDIYAPVSGEVAAINEDLLESPEQINENAYDAWLVRIRQVIRKEELMTSEAYISYIESL